MSLTCALKILYSQTTLSGGLPRDNNRSSIRCNAESRARSPLSAMTEFAEISLRWRGGVAMSRSFRLEQSAYSLYNRSATSLRYGDVGRVAV